MRRAVLVLLILALVVGPSLWLLTGDDVPYTEPETDAPVMAPESAPVLHASGQAPTTRTSEGAPPADVLSPDDVDTPAASPHVLVGLVTGLAVKEHAQTTIFVRAVGQHSLVDGLWSAARGVPTALGQFTIDIGALRKAEPETTHVQVSVDHPDYLVAKDRVLLAPGDTKQTEVAKPLAMVRAAIFEGRVLAPNGEPLTEALVAAYRLNGNQVAMDSVREAEALDTTETDGSGAFRLRCPRVMRALVAARGPRFLPIGQVVDLTDADLQAALTLRLRAGERITGRVDLQGAGAPSAHITADRDLEGETYLAWVYSSWHEGHVVATDGGTSTDARGYFELTMLEPGRWTVSVGALDGYTVWGSIRQATTQTLEAPTLDAHFEVGGAALILTTVSGGEPLKHVRIEHKEASGATGTMFSGDGRLALLLPPDLPMTLTASKAHYASVTKEVPALRVGTTTELVFDLGARKATARLRVKIRDAAGQPVGRAAFLFLAPEADPNDHLLDEPDHVLGSVDGMFAMKDLKPGRTRVVVTPGCGPDHLTGLYLRDAKALDLRPGEEASLTVQARRGGRVTVTVKDVDGNTIACGARLLDQGGKTVPVVWSWSTEDSSTLASGWLGAADADMQPVLAPGTYELVCNATGYVEQRERFKVKRGAYQRLTITLRKK